MADEKEILKEVTEKLIRIEGLLENIKNTNELKLENMEDKIKVANNRIKDLEDTSKWLWRTVIGGLIAAVMSLIIKFK